MQPASHRNGEILGTWEITNGNKGSGICYNWVIVVAVLCDVQGKLLIMAASTPPAQKPNFQFLGTLIAVLAVVLVLQWTSKNGIIGPATETALPDSTIPWREDYATALAESRASGKPVLVVFSASWCPPCKTMKRQVWPDAKVAAAVENGFVSMYVDVDLKQYEPVVERYNIRGIPSILVLDGEGQVVRQAGSMSRSETLDFLDAGRT